jgi:hypothetical protein
MVAVPDFLTLPAKSVAVPDFFMGFPSLLESVRRGIKEFSGEA